MEFLSVINLSSDCYISTPEARDTAGSVSRRLICSVKESITIHPDLLEYGPVRFHGDPNALSDRHLVFDYAIDPDLAIPRERYEAVARSLRDVLALRWLRTKKTHFQKNVKHAYYLSMEFLIGRSLANNVTNLLLDPRIFGNLIIRARKVEHPSERL